MLDIKNEIKNSGQRLVNPKEHNSWFFLLELSFFTSLVLFFFGFLMYLYAAEQQERYTDIVAESYLTQMQDSMAMWLDGEMGMIRSIATDGDVIQSMLTPGDAEAVRAAELMIRGAHRARPHYTVISLVADRLSGGKATVLRNGDKISIKRGMVFADSINGDAVGVNILDYNYGKAIFNGSKFFISAAKENALEGKDPVFVISARVENKGKFIGVVCIGVKLKYFSSRFIHSDVLGANVALSVADNRGYIIAAYDPSAVLNDNTREKMKALFSRIYLNGDGFRSDPLDPVNRELMMRKFTLNSDNSEFVFENKWYLLLSKEKRMLFGGNKDYLRSNIMALTLFSVLLMMSVIGVIGWIFIHKVRAAQSALEDINRELERSSRLDSLTGLPNRRAYAEMARELESEKVVPLGIISLDVDGLKIINDMLGHAAGDNLLVDAANLLADIIKEPACLFRTGGDEFIALCPESNEDVLSDIQGRIMERLAKQESDFMVPSVHISCGYAVRNNSEIPLEELYQKADDQMYRYKRANNMHLRKKLFALAQNALVQSEPCVEERQMIRKQLIDIVTSLRAEFASYRESLLLLSQYYCIGRVVRANVDEGEDRYFVDSRAEDQRIAEMGFRIAMVFPQTLSVAHLILRQYEWWSEQEDALLIGQDELPMECRIFAVLETFEEQSWKHMGDLKAGCEKGLAAIRSVSGTRLDPAIVDLFVSEVIPKFCNEEEV